MKEEILVSFAHGYNDDMYNPKGDERPALWHIKDGKSEFFSYIFPRNPEDFRNIKDLILGELPLENAREFKTKLPRFGFTGLKVIGDYAYAGSWNSVYKIRLKDFKLVNIISNRMMGDTHGIYVDEENIITILTCMDAVIISDHKGNIKDYFSISNDLSIKKDKKLEDTDWRFISKQHRGSTGYWHFNFIQKFGDELWLTARNANCFVVVNTKTKKAKLRLMNLCTPALIHDGILYKGKYYFTSIDGKILIAEDHEKTNYQQREYVDNIQLYNRDLVTKLIRLEETELGKEPNWCRGIAVKDEKMYVSIDGRYDTDLSFGLLVLDEEGKVYENYRLKWKDIDDESKIRFVTGFDVVVLS